MCHETRTEIKVKQGDQVMRLLTLLPFILLPLCFGCVIGCSDEARVDEAAAQAPAAPAVTLPPGFVVAAPVAAPTHENQIYTRVQTPARTEYTGEGKLITRDVVAARVMTPFGVSPGETISKQTPMTVQQGVTPGISINPYGVGASAAGPSTFTGGGGKWSWWDTLKTRLHDWGLGFLGIGAVVGIGCLLLWLFVPGARGAISAVGRAILSVFPFVGSLVENAIGKAKEAAVVKPLVEVIDGGQAFKDFVAREPTFAADVKAKIVELFTAAHVTAQDTSTQATVKSIKASL
jgi:hypothetical protein